MYFSFYQRVAMMSTRARGRLRAGIVREMPSMANKDWGLGRNPHGRVGASPFSHGRPVGRATACRPDRDGEQRGEPQGNQAARAGSAMPRPRTSGLRQRLP